jgi:hypothetical protein
MKELNETIKNILLEHKNQAYAIDEKRYGFSLGDDDYKKVTGVDLETLSLEHGNNNVYGEVRYCKNDEGCIELQFETMVADVSQDSLSGVIVAPDVKEDYLQLFSDVVMTKDKIKAWLKGETEVDGDTLSNFEIVMKIIDEEHYNKFMDYLDDYGVENLPDGLKEKCAMNYISDNPSSACRDAIGYMSSYDTKDVIKDLIDNL